MSASAPSSSLKVPMPFGLPKKFCTTVSAAKSRHAELPPRSCLRGRGPAMKQIARGAVNT